VYELLTCPINFVNNVLRSLGCTDFYLYRVEKRSRIEINASLKCRAHIRKRFSFFVVLCSLSFKNSIYIPNTFFFSDLGMNRRNCCRFKNVENFAKNPPKKLEKKKLMHLVVKFINAIFAKLFSALLSILKFAFPETLRFLF
jgi:hypothetical protein